MQPFLGDVDLIAENQFHCLRQFAGDRRFLAAAGRRGCLRFLFSVVLRRQAYAEDATTAFGPLYDRINVRPAYLAHGREKRPLVCPGDEVVIEEDAVVLLARSFL